MHSTRLLLAVLILLSTAAASAAQDPPARRGSDRDRSRTFVLPHVLERYGGAQFGGGGSMGSFRTIVTAFYAAGLGGTRAGEGATLELYLYDEAGQPLRKNSGADVCNPCGYPLSAAARKHSIRIDDLIGDGGGAARLGFGVIVIKGDADNVSLQGFVTNTHEGGATSVFTFEPQELETRGR